MDREPAIAAVIEACGAMRRAARCRASNAPVVFAAVSEARCAVSQISRGSLRKSATIYLETIAPGSLENVSIKRAHDRLRVRMRRCGFGNSIVIGPAAPSGPWIDRDHVWILHVHALAIGVDAETWDALEEKLAKSGRATPLVVNDMNDPERQLSYAQKFVTYHRPGRRTGKRPARPYPLPRDRLVELVRWWMHRQFEDFPFLFGARRRGGRIVPER